MSDCRFMEYLQGKLLDPTESAKHGQGAFPGALAWFLCQDPATPLSWRYNYRELVDQDCGPENSSFELRNEASCNQFVYWARFLGFAWRLNIDNRNSVIPDPTKSIARSLGRWEEMTDWRPIRRSFSRDWPSTCQYWRAVQPGPRLNPKLARDKHRPDEHYISFHQLRIAALGAQWAD